MANIQYASLVLEALNWTISLFFCLCLHLCLLILFPIIFFTLHIFSLPLLYPSLIYSVPHFSTSFSFPFSFYSLPSLPPLPLPPCLSPCCLSDSAEWSVCVAGARPHLSFWELHERREPIARAGWRLHSGHPAQTQGRQEQCECMLSSDRNCLITVLRECLCPQMSEWLAAC